MPLPKQKVGTIEVVSPGNREMDYYVKPVSYTHLDVYKRQPRHWAGKGCGFRCLLGF